MSTYALLDENNIVINIIYVLDDGLTEEETCDNLTGMHGGRWKKTDPEGGLRKNFGERGSFYDESKDVFIPPKQYDYMILNENTYRWDFPIPEPNDGKHYIWDHQKMGWIEFVDKSSLFSLNGSYPAPLPNRIRLSDGSTRTDIETFTAEEISDAGYVEVPPIPEVDENHEVVWTGFSWRIDEINRTPTEDK